jgi:uncharacterized protein
MRVLASVALLFAVAAPQRWVTDDAQALTPAVRQQLDARLEAFEQATGHQLVVYVGRTTGGVPIEDWAQRTFKEWKVGRAGLDDGAALFVFVDDRAARVEVGYGLESVLTDAASARILREVVAPKMAAGDVDGALSGGVEAIVSTIGDGAPAGSPSAPYRLGPIEWVAVALVAVAFVALAIWKPHLAWALLMLVVGRRRGGGSGGFHGGGGRSGGGGATGRW